LNFYLREWTSFDGNMNTSVVSMNRTQTIIAVPAKRYIRDFAYLPVPL